MHEIERFYNRRVFCKHFLDKVAKHFWTLLQVQIGQSCKASTGSYPASGKPGGQSVEETGA